MENEDYRKTNREKVLSPKSKAMHWCEHCDRNYMPSGDKCGVCRKISGIRRLKKGA